MTRIKYTSVYRRRDDDSVFLTRGGRSANQATIQTREWEADRIEVIDLPEPMSPDEYRDWAKKSASDVLGEYVNDE